MTLSLKLSEEEAVAVRWRRVEEWVRTSSTLVAPRRQAKLVLDEGAEA